MIDNAAELFDAINASVRSYGVAVMASDWACGNDERLAAVMALLDLHADASVEVRREAVRQLIYGAAYCSAQG